MYVPETVSLNHHTIHETTMPVQYAIALFDNFLSTALEFSARLPAPITGVLLIAIGVCIYETLGNSRAPGNWR